MPNFKPPNLGFHILYGKAARDAAHDASHPGPRRWVVVMYYLHGALFILGAILFGLGAYKSWMEMSLGGACSAFLAHSVWKIIAALGYAGEDEKLDGVEKVHALLHYGMLGAGSAFGVLMILSKWLGLMYEDSS